MASPESLSTHPIAQAPPETASSRTVPVSNGFAGDTFSSDTPLISVATATLSAQYTDLVQNRKLDSTLRANLTDTISELSVRATALSRSCSTLWTEHPVAASHGDSSQDASHLVHEVDAVQLVLRKLISIQKQMSDHSSLTAKCEKSFLASAKEVLNLLDPRSSFSGRDFESVATDTNESLTDQSEAAAVPMHPLLHSYLEAVGDARIYQERIWELQDSLQDDRTSRDMILDQDGQPSSEYDEIEADTKARIEEAKAQLLDAELILATRKSDCIKQGLVIPPDDNYLGSNDWLLEQGTGESTAALSSPGSQYSSDFSTKKRGVVADWIESTMDRNLVLGNEVAMNASVDVDQPTATATATGNTILSVRSHRQRFPMDTQKGESSSPGAPEVTSPESESSVPGKRQLRGGRLCNDSRNAELLAAAENADDQSTGAVKPVDSHVASHDPRWAISSKGRRFSEVSERNGYRHASKRQGK